MQDKLILLVDDEECLLRVLGFNIQKFGHRFIMARNGVEGFEQAQKHKPDLILTDYQMPQLDGLGLCTKLMASDLTKHIPVVLLTARGHRLQPSDMETHKIRCVLQKPFSIRELKEKVVALLGGTDAPAYPLAATPILGAVGSLR